VRRLIAVATVAAMLAGPAVAAAAASCPRTTLGDVEDEVMCPVCGVPLNLATDAPQANRERAFITAQIRQCRTRSQIKDALAAQFGDRVLATPKPKGFGLTAYVLPIAGFLAATAAIVVAALRWRRRRPREAAAGAAAVDPQDAARLEADLRRYDL
jgi:cytochrome c-type biogenesis protein CcmH/NrfF